MRARHVVGGVLSGIAITTVFGAGMNTVMIVAPDAYVGSSVFLAGGLTGVLLSDLAWPAVLIAAGLVAAMCGAHRLNVVALGDDMAHALGLNVRAVRLAMLAVASLLAGAAVSFAGLLGFVGLIVPHIVRFAVGNDNRAVLPLSAVAGAAFVVGCNLIARVAFAPYEVPVGILMAFVGGPFFIYLIFKNKGILNELSRFGPSFARTRIRARAARRRLFVRSLRPLVDVRSDSNEAR